jgi:type VI protein secretion system component Hcp
MKTIFSAKCSLLKTLSIGLVALVLIPSVAHAYVFLELDGIKRKITDWTKFDNFYPGVTNASLVGTFDESGKPIFNDFKWSQELDRSDIISGDKITRAVVSFQTSGAIPKAYFKITFEDVLLTRIERYDLSQVPRLEGSFAYGTIMLEYWKLDREGRLIADGMVKHDLVKGNGSVGELATLYARGLSGPEFVTHMPEPETYAMLIAGIGLLGVIARRRLRVGAA